MRSMQTRLVDLVRQLGDDDGLAIALADVLECALRAHGQASAPRPIRGRNFLRAVDDAAGREIRTRNVLHQIRERDRRVIQQRKAGVDDLRQVVRRDVGGHADRDARLTVDQQVRVRAWAAPTARSPTRRNSA